MTMTSRFGCTLDVYLAVLILITNVYAAPISEVDDSLYDGKICMTVEPFRKASNMTEYYECAPLSDEETVSYNLTDKYLGVWVLRKCPANFDFDDTKQRCIDRKKLRRQQGQGDLQRCYASNSNPTVGNQCDWLSATLQPDPQSNAYFLQCAPQDFGQPCGEWVRMPCTPGTVFDPAAQICVPSSIASPSGCSGGGRPVCPCAVQQSTCPGASTCQKPSQVCCQTPLSTSPAMMQNYGSPVCIGSGAQPMGACSSGCSQSAQCQPNIGCCPQSASPAMSPTISISLCPDANSLPVTSCSNGSPCPQGSSCVQSMGACCPTQRQALQMNVIQLCPGGTISQQSCGFQNQCPPGTGCFEGACCPMLCPQGQTASGFCNNGRQCGGSSTCYEPGGCCCSQLHRRMLPICPNGQVASGRCANDLMCGFGLECSNGGCCPMPFCPNGRQATSRCIAGSVSCNSGNVCLGGLCCTLPSCGNGYQANGICAAGIDCTSGFECSNGGCCPLPQCPNGVIATQGCASNRCPNNQQCIGGGCCPLPTCANGIIAAASCGSGYQCGSGFECSNGGCCPLPLCPSGIASSQRCLTGTGCSNTQSCWNGVCCPRPMCSTGQFAQQSCGSGNSCQTGFICEGAERGCCPEPLPLCPNGGRATHRCVRGSDCRAGYGCSHLNGCCPLSMSLAVSLCPQSMNPVCQCSASNGCPAQSLCNQGTCCSSLVAAYNLSPGTGCQASTQCNGYSNQCTSCQQSTCVCVNGAWSNGVTCQQQPFTILRRARNGCDQYGSGCRVFLSSARRKPLFAPVGNVSIEQPLWYNVAKERRCLSNSSIPEFDADSTCLPSEKCINGVCRTRLWPGEYGCEVDSECTSRCPNTYCEPLKSDKGISQCQCRNGMLLYGRCFETCPHGFHESGGYCMHDDDEAFWNDGTAQDQLNALLNTGKC